MQGTQDHYERLPRENSAMGRAEDHYNDLRQSDWEQREHIRNDSYEYPRPVFGEPRRSRSPIKGKSYKTFDLLAQKFSVVCVLFKYLISCKEFLVCKTHL